MLRDDARSKKISIIPNCILNYYDGADTAVPLYKDILSQILDANFGIISFPHPDLASKFQEKAFHTIANNISSYVSNGYSVYILTSSDSSFLTEQYHILFETMERMGLSLCRDDAILHGNYSLKKINTVK